VRPGFRGNMTGVNYFPPILKIPPPSPENIFFPPFSFPPFLFTKQRVASSAALQKVRVRSLPSLPRTYRFSQTSSLLPLPLQLAQNLALTISSDAVVFFSNSLSTRFRHVPRYVTSFSVKRFFSMDPNASAPSLLDFSSPHRFHNLLREPGILPLATSFRFFLQSLRRGDHPLLLGFCWFLPKV